MSKPVRRRNATKKNLPEGYTLQGNYELTGNQNPFPTRRLDNGAIIIIEGSTRQDGAEAYDANGRWLGLFRSVALAEEAAEEGYCADFQEKASELSAWQLWNDATQHGTSVLEDDHGAQIIKVSDEVYLRAKSDKHGWAVDWLNDKELNSEYYVGEYYTLRYADKPIVLE